MQRTMCIASTVLFSALFLAPGIFAACDPITCTTIVPPGAVFFETWTKAGSPYCVTGDIQVSLLTIEPGVTVAVDGPYEIQVLSTITAIGTQSDPITFTASDPSTCWMGLRFDNAQTGSDLTHCIIEQSSRGGITIVNGPAPLISNSVIRNNSRSGHGGGIEATNVTDNMEIVRTHFSGNTASQHGGALHVSMADIPSSPGSFFTLTIADSRFEGNTSNPSLAVGNYVGGALYLTGGDMVISGSRFVGNRQNSRCSNTFDCSVTARGGAVYLAGSGDVIIRNTELIGNDTYAQNNGNCFFGGSSRSYGGGIYQASGTLTVNNAILSCNGTTLTNCGASDGGGGLYVFGGTATVANSNFVRHPNSTGVHLAGGTLEVIDSIIYENQDDNVGGTPTITYSDVEQFAGVFSGDGNINLNPVFFGADCEPRDFLLIPGSPCIDQGSGLTDTCFPPTSPFGNDATDMGAYGGAGACDWAPHERTELRFTSKVDLEWLTDNMFVETASSFSLYRGSFGQGGWAMNHACFDSNLPTTNAVDSEPPASPGNGFYYLVAGNTGTGGDGTLGDSSVQSCTCGASSQTRGEERERPNDAICISVP